MVRKNKFKFIFFVTIWLMLMSTFSQIQYSQAAHSSDLSINLNNFGTFRSPGGIFRSANAVNNYGMIVGRGSDSGTRHGFLRNPDGSFIVIDPPGALHSSAADINDKGTIVGSFTDALGTHGFVRNPDGEFVTFDIPGATDPNPRGINNHGTIVGFADGVGGFIRQQDGNVTFLGMVPEGINDEGIIVGRFPGLDNPVIRHPDGSLTEIQLPGLVIDLAFANDINNHGIVVGHVDEDGETIQYLRRLNGEIVYFNLVGGPEEEETYGINDSGIIVGWTGSEEQGFFTLPPDQSLTTLQDAFLRSTNKNRNEGANPNLFIKKGFRVVLDFNLALLPPAESIAQAILTVNLAQPANSWGKNGRLLTAHRLDQSFTEGNRVFWGQKRGKRDRGEGPGVTWNCATDTDIRNRRANCEERWNGASNAMDMATDLAVIMRRQTGEVSWDVTVDVLAALANGDANIQWLIKKAKERKSGRAIFYSKEGAVEVKDLTKAPRLELQFAD